MRLSYLGNQKTVNNQVREIEDSAAVSGKRARSDRLAEKFELAELALWRVAGPVSVVSSERMVHLVRGLLGSRSCLLLSVSGGLKTVIIPSNPIGWCPAGQALSTLRSVGRVVPLISVTQCRTNLGLFSPLSGTLRKHLLPWTFPDLSISRVRRNLPDLQATEPFCVKSGFPYAKKRSSTLAIHSRWVQRSVCFQHQLTER